MGPRPVGVIEGFYGPPWSWEARRTVAGWCGARGMTDYVYAPKDDPKHRDHWREPYAADELQGFERFAEDGALRLGFALSPGLSIDCDDADDRAAVLAKLTQVVAVGASLVVLALDDIPFGGGPQGEAHARLTRWLRDELDPEIDLALVPTEYVGTNPSPHLEALAEGVPPEVPIAWTGLTVVNDEITVAQAEARAAALGGRPPLLWDNYPVNDGPMADRLFVGPLRGRDPALPDALGGYLANPMVQPVASTLPLASIAAWLRDEDPLEVWRSTAADLGWLAFALACDTDEPHAAVAAAAAGDLRPARALFADAAACAAPGLEGEADDWVSQVQRDARLALRALDLLDGDRSPMDLLAIGVRWQKSRRAPITVFGPRCSIRPMVGQADDGTWLTQPGAIEHDDNAIDALVRLALASLD